MDFKDVVNNRHSIRQFLSDPVSIEKIKEILTVAQLAPSAGNRQAYRVVIVTNMERNALLSRVVAPVKVVFCAAVEESEQRYGDRGRALYAVQDATILAAYFQLALVNDGLASVWEGGFWTERVKGLVEIEDNFIPVAIIAVGYPAIEKSGHRRKLLDEIVLKVI